jgi:bromodomain-containing factor 1
VDWQSLGLWDYPKIIREPMDLSEVERKLVENRYQNRLDFAKDIRLVWKNAMAYNKPN